MTSELHALRTQTAATRTTRERYDDPATDEKQILLWGIASTDDLRAAAARDNKSGALLAAIISYTIDVAKFDEDGTEAVLMPLLEEPNLGPGDLLCMTLPVHGRTHLSGPLLAAICAHPHADRDTLVSGLWNAQQDTAAQVAAATGKQLAAAIAWVRRVGAHGETGPYSTPAQRQDIAETEHRWAAWSSNSPARAAFLLASSFAFALEDDLLAAGAAICASPVATA